jgi:hypothetical protein
LFGLMLCEERLDLGQRGQFNASFFKNKLYLA